MRMVDRLRSRWPHGPGRHRTLPALALLAVFLGCAWAGAEPRSFNLVQMCDPQIGLVDYHAELARFRQAVRQINALKPDLVVICGDLVQTRSRNSFADFNAAKAAFKVPCYCAPGNHDVGDRPTPESLRLYRQSIGKDYYSFEHADCEFIVVNTQLWKVTVPEESARHDAWFREALEAAAQRGRRIVVVGHIPLFGRTPDEPDGHDNLPLPKRRELLSLFDRYGVQLMLAGHTHRTLFVQYGRTQIVTSATTSLNVDFGPFGFRFWHIALVPPFQHEFVPVKTPPKEPSPTPEPAMVGH